MATLASINGFDEERTPQNLSLATAINPVEDAVINTRNQRLQKAAQRPGLLGQAARSKMAGSFNVVSSGQNDLSEAKRLNTLADSMKRDRMQKTERRDATRLRQDMQSNQRIGRFNAGLAAGGTGRFQDEAAKSAASFLGQAQQQQEQIAGGGSLGAVIARQNEQNDARTLAGQKLAGEQSIADKQLSMRALEGQKQRDIQQERLGIDKQRLGVDQQRVDTMKMTAEAELAKKSLSPFETRQETNAADELDKVLSVAGKAKQTIPLLAEAAGLNEEGVTGALAKPAAFAASLVAGIIPGADDYATKIQRIESISNQLALGNKDVLEITGVLSDTDIKLLQSTVINPSNTQEANQRILETQLNLQKLALEKADALGKARTAEEYREIKENFGKEDLAAAMDKVYSAAITDEQLAALPQLGATAEDIVTTARENDMTPDQVIQTLMQRQQGGQ